MEEVNNALPSDHPLQDFRNFLDLVWEFLALPEPTPIQLDIAHNMQELCERDLHHRKGIVQAGRGTGKSFICSSFAVWKLLLDPTEKILVVSGNEERAKQFTLFTKKLIDNMDILAHLRGGERNSTLSFDVAGSGTSHSPSVKAAGIMGAITGSRATLIIGDDVETPSNSETIGSQEKLDERVKEFGDIIVPESQRIIFLGTPQTEASVYNKLNDRGYDLRVWTAEYVSQKENIDKWNGNVMPFCVDDDKAAKNSRDMGEPTEPTRFSKSILEVKRLEHGMTRYMQQYQLCPALLDQDKYPLKLNDLIVMDVDREKAHQYHIYASRLDCAIKDLPMVGFNGDRYFQPLESGGGLVEFTGSVMTIDPSGRGGDETGYAVTKMLNGYIYVMEAGGIKGGFEEQTLEKLAYIAQSNGVNEIIVESNFGDGMFCELLKPITQRIYPVAISEVRSNTNKENRIADVLEPVMNSHKLVINKSVIESDHEQIQKYPAESAVNYSLFYQMSRLTRVKGCLRNDDRLDALAMSVAYWIEAVAQDAKVQMDLRNQKAMEDEMRDFMSNVVGARPKSMTFF